MVCNTIFLKDRNLEDRPQIYNVMTSIKISALKIWRQLIIQNLGENLFNKLMHSEFRLSIFFPTSKSECKVHLSQNLSTQIYPSSILRVSVSDCEAPTLASGLTLSFVPGPQVLTVFLSGHISDVPSGRTEERREERVLLASGEYRPGTLLDNLQWTKQSLQRRITWTNILRVLGFRNPDWKDGGCKGRESMSPVHHHYIPRTVLSTTTNTCVYYINYLCVAVRPRDGLRGYYICSIQIAKQNYSHCQDWKGI